MRYLLLNSLVLVSLFGAALRQQRKRARWSAIAPTMITVLLITVVFDSLIVSAHIVGYNTSHILGLYVGRAPIEDLAYAIASVGMASLLWEYYGQKR